MIRQTSFRSSATSKLQDVCDDLYARTMAFILRMWKPSLLPRRVWENLKWSGYRGSFYDTG